MTTGGWRCSTAAGPGGGDDLNTLLAEIGDGGGAAARAPHSGYIRLQAGQLTALADGGGPPPAPYDTAAHAGAASVEISVGATRMVVNCGALDRADSGWRMVQRGTAAHSTLCVADTNSSAVSPGGGFSRRRATAEASVTAASDSGGPEATITHTGYQKRFGLTHARRLCLAADGGSARGEDTLTGAGAAEGLPFAIRFHLHPMVNVLALHGGGALLKLADGGAWRFECAGGAGMAVEGGIWLGDGRARRTSQIVVQGRVGGGGDVRARVTWAFTRAT